MQETNQPQIDQIIAALEEAEACAVELDRVKKFTTRRTEYVKVGPVPKPEKAPYPE